MSVVSSFITFLKINRSSSEKTIKSYLDDLKSFCKFLNKDIENINLLGRINGDEIKKWLMERKKTVSNRTISRQIISIKMFFTFLNEIYDVRNDVILNMSGLKFNNNLPKAIECRQIEDIIKNIDNILNYDNDWELARDRLLLILLFSSGMRISEALSLKHGDFLKSEFIIFGKGKKERIVPILDIVKEYYEIYRQKLLENNIQTQNGFAFVNKKNKQLTSREAERIFQKIKINKNLQYFSPHIMRHSFASSMLENGANICQIQELLGHANLDTTQKYTKITKKIIGDKLKKIKW